MCTWLVHMIHNFDYTLTLPRDVSAAVHPLNVRSADRRGVPVTQWPRSCSAGNALLCKSKSHNTRHHIVPLPSRSSLHDCFIVALANNPPPFKAAQLLVTVGQPIRQYCWSKSFGITRRTIVGISHGGLLCLLSEGYEARKSRKETQIQRLLCIQRCGGEVELWKKMVFF